MRYISIIIFLIGLIPQHVWGGTVYDSIKIVVEGHAITENEIEMRAFELARAKTGRQPTADSIKEFKKEARELLIDDTLLDAKADELMIHIGEDELDEEIEQFQKQRNINQLEFEELLERQNMSLEDFRKTYRRQLRRNRVIAREVRPNINVDEEALKKKYENNESAEKLVHARHILLLVSKNAPKEKVEQVKNKAIELRQRILNGESFEKIADQYSEDPSVKSNHGDLGFFRKNDMVKEFSDAAFNLEPGKISEPVRSPFGFHLIQVIETKKEQKQSFESVKNKLMQQAYQEQFKTQYAQYISDLKKKAKISYK